MGKADAGVGRERRGKTPPSRRPDLRLSAPKLRCALAAL